MLTYRKKESGSTLAAGLWSWIRKEEDGAGIRSGRWFPSGNGRLHLLVHSLSFRLFPQSLHLIVKISPITSYILKIKKVKSSSSTQIRTLWYPKEKSGPWIIPKTATL
jgi:hypothetical protein